jgi:hypothetical protein
MPVPPPVMTAILPAKSFMILLRRFSPHSVLNHRLRGQRKFTAFGVQKSSQMS